MKRFVTLMIVFFAIYLGLQIAFKFTVGGYESKYEIKGDRTYQIKETYTVNKKGEHDNYFLTIDDGKNQFVFQLYKDLGKIERIVKDVKSYSGDHYQCILPIFRNGQTLVDVTCLSNGMQYYYHDIQGKDIGLDTFVSTLTKEEYSLEQFKDFSTGDSFSSNVTIYQDNLVDGHYLAFENYRGVYLMNLRNAKSLYDVDLFNQDVYNMNVSAIVGRYYIVADYDSEYEFHKFYLIDMKTLKTATIDSHHILSFDSYVQGVVENSVYIFDRNSKKQYELNIKLKTIVEVGNVELKTKYYNQGKWETVSAYDAANQNLYFKTQITSDDFKGYEKVDKVGNQLSGYYYFYKKVGNQYEVYRSNIQEPLKQTYLFTTDTISKIVYLDDYIYYVNGDTIYYYQDEVGVRKIYQNTEIKFNSSLIYGICE